MTDILFELPGAADGEDSPILDQWLVGDGETVSQGQHIAVVAIAKSSVDVEAPVSGRLRIMVQVQETVVPGQPIARVE